MDNEQDDSLTLKVVGLFVMLVITLFFAFLPFYSKLREGRMTAFGEAFSGGVFLAVSLLDLIPDSFEDFDEYAEEAGLDEAYPYPTLMVVIGFVFGLGSTLFARHIANDRNAMKQADDIPLKGFSLRNAVFLLVLFSLATPVGIAVGIGINTEDPLAVSLLNGLAAGTFLFVAAQVIFGLFNGGEGHSHDVAVAESKTQAFLLAFMLTFHSVIEGLAVGVQTTFADTAVIFIAIMLHKGVAAYAVGTNIVQSTELKRNTGQQEMDNQASDADKLENGSESPSGSTDGGAAGDKSSQEYKDVELDATRKEAQTPSAEGGLLSAPAEDHHDLVGKHKHHDLSSLEAISTLLGGITVFAIIRIFVG